MQAVILAGGKGIRLKPLTYQTPKSMISIHGKPFLQYQLELIRSFGINEILFLFSYLGRQIGDYFRNGSGFNLNIDYSYEEDLLGTAGALKNAEGKLRNVFLLLYGDTYLSIDYKKLIDYFYQFKKTGVITVYNNLDKIAPNNVKINESNLVIDYNKNNDKNMNCLDAGLMIFKKEIVAFIERNKKTSLEEEIFPKLIEVKELIAYPVNQRFYDMGSFKGLGLLEEKLK